MVLRVKWTSSSSSCTAGEAGHSLKFSFLWGRNHGLRRSFLSLNCATWGSSDSGKVICLASFTFSHAYKLVFFALEECSNFNSGNLDIHKVSLTHKWLSKCFPGAPRPQSRGTGVCSWGTAGSGSSWGSTTRTKYSYYTRHRLARLPLSPFAYDVGSHSSNKGSFFPRMNIRPLLLKGENE